MSVVFQQRKPRLIDRKKCLELWVECGSTSTLYHLYQERVGINEQTGKPFAEQALWYAALQYIVEEPENARVLVNKDLEYNEYPPFTDDEWDAFLIDKAIKVFRRGKHKSFAKWLVKQGYDEEKYRKHYIGFIKEIVQKYPRYRPIYKRFILGEMRLLQTGGYSSTRDNSQIIST